MNRRALVVGLVVAGVLVIASLHLYGAFDPSASDPSASDPSASDPSAPAVRAAAPPSPLVDEDEALAPSELEPSGPAPTEPVVVEGAAPAAQDPSAPVIPEPTVAAPPNAALPSVGSLAGVAEPGAAQGDVAAQFHEAFGDPDPEHERQMIEARRQRSLEVVEGLMAGLAAQEEDARRRGDLVHAQKLADSLHRLEWRHRTLDTSPADAPSAEGTDPAP